jgi:hypothetical protein
VHPSEEILKGSIHAFDDIFKHLSLFVRGIQAKQVRLAEFLLLSFHLSFLSLLLRHAFVALSPA